MAAAYGAVGRAAAERQLPVAQFHTTLLLAIQTQLICDGTPYSLVLSCAIGDGMVGVIDRTGKCRLLMQPDGGQYAGEVEFLSSRLIAPERLAARIFPFVGTLRALMVISDGVADDFFPNDPGMARLYGDLVLNGIVPVPREPKDGGAAATPGTSGEEEKEPERCSEGQAQAGSLCHCGGAREVPGSAEFAETGYRLLPEGDMAVTLASAQRYAEALGISAEELATRPDLLATGVARCPMPLSGETGPEKRLLVWLDAYHVRGSFDDRTLVVLCPREGA
jgi:hypothetical protein